MKRFYTFFIILVVSSCFMPIASAQVISIPDPNLEAVVRAEIGLDPLDDLTWGKMQELLVVVVRDSNINGGEQL